MYNTIIKFIDANLIYCLIPMILTLILFESLFKVKFQTRKVLRIISWVIIVYALVSLFHFLVQVVFRQSKTTFIERATGSHRMTYWIMFLLSTIFPLTLLVKKFSEKFWYVLLIAFLIKLGVYFEHFIIVTTSLHRDNGSNDILNLWITRIIMTTIQGFIFVALSLGILRWIELRKER